MEFNLLAPLLFMPSLVYFAIQLLRRRSGRGAARELGWSLPSWRNLVEAALVLLALAGMAAVVFRLIPSGALESEEMRTAAYTGWLQGWLRVRSESVIPSTMVHTITNVLGLLPVLG